MSPSSSKPPILVSSTISLLKNSLTLIGKLPLITLTSVPDGISLSLIRNSQARSPFAEIVLTKRFSTIIPLGTTANKVIIMLAIATAITRNITQPFFITHLLSLNFLMSNQTGLNNSI